jgi:hypothetical protein
MQYHFPFLVGYLAGGWLSIETSETFFFEVFVALPVPYAATGAVVGAGG